MDINLALSYLVGSWLIGFISGLLLRVVLKFYVEWMS